MRNLIHVLPVCIRVSFVIPLLLLLLWSPSITDAADDELENYTFTLTQSTAGHTFWTTPPSERVFKDDAPPEETGSQVLVYTAKNEFEPFQIVVNPASTGNVQVTIGDFGTGVTAELYQVKYVNIETVSDNLGRSGDYPDPLWPLENGANVNLTAGENTAFWVSLNISSTAAAGDHLGSVTIGGTTIPVNLHVFNFSVPDELHVKSQMNFSHNAVLQKYGVSGTGDNYWMYVDMMKQFFIDHRLTSKSPLWSGGLTSSGGASYITYDCDAQTLTDPWDIWGFEKPAKKYLDGVGFEEGELFNDGVGFPSFMAITFQNNDSSQDQRPSTFCGSSRSANDWYTANNPDSVYNTKWKDYMHATQEYLRGLGYLDRAYYYMANEPQDDEDYKAVAWYANLLKSAASDLKLMVSEEPKEEIYNNATFPGAKIDIWLPVLNNYDPDISHDREKNHQEETWVYFLHGTRPPYYNPITLDHPGIESKFTGWLLWKYRIRGIAYYSMNGWSKNPWTSPMTDGHNGDTFMFYPPSEDNSAIDYGANNHRLVPSIRLELMRDSLEDYEYLYLLNGGANPLVDAVNPSDAQADKIISSLTSYTRDSQFMYNLRKYIGQYLGNEIAEIPDISPLVLHDRSQGEPDNYYINFQNPAGEPAANPLIVDGKTYMKIGWNDYDQGLGYGWYGDMAHVEYQYLSSAPNVLQGSILYDDWGREKTFEFDLPNGNYEITVSVGWQGRTYSHNQIVVEGVDFVVDEATSPYLVRTRMVEVKDYKLTMEMGIFDEYTMLNYMEIKGRSDIAGDLNGDSNINLTDAVLVLKILAGRKTGALNPEADVNADSAFGLEEAIYILQTQAGM
ncbi:glycoside hydrolase domain-containing protein [Desulfatibacillum aliphaticivorans]|uniref:glycoside hydrolase domain-containing protein n=1 Tax=Desulfatibacillum aliphaticivorans TaxID=218208 RepID=UPI00040C0621|nr:glycoside hydrolase domain-containing protein [Desulfatibacillum aliphaticivorans]